MINKLLFYSINYITEHFSENIDVSESKVERVIFELFKFVY